MSPKKISRRAFIRLASLTGISLALIALDRATQPIGLTRSTRWLLSGEVNQRLGQPEIVALGDCQNYDEREIFDCLSDLWNQAEMPSVAGKRILVKPNLIDHLEPYPVTTAPQVIGALLDLLNKLGAEEVVVGDGPGFRRDVGSVADASGLTPVLESRKTRLVDLNYDDPKPIRTRGGWFLHTNRIWMPHHVRKADLIISVPKLKTHHWAGVSLSLKNLFGTVPGMRYGWPKNFLHFNGIPLSILGLYESIPPVVAVVDGITGMEGDGPLFGGPVDHRLLAVGRDPVAVDSVCAGLMGFSTEEIDHLFLANWAGVGQGEKINTIGLSPEEVTIPYQKPPEV